MDLDFCKYSGLCPSGVPVGVLAGVLVGVCRFVLVGTSITNQISLRLLNWDLYSYIYVGILIVFHLISMAGYWLFTNILRGCNSLLIVLLG